MTINHNPRRVRCFVAGHVIADTTDALTVDDDGVTTEYFPREDVETGFLSESLNRPDDADDRATWYGMSIDGELYEHAAWSYEDPEPGMEALRGRIAFNPAYFEVYEPEVEPRRNHHLHP